MKKKLTRLFSVLLAAVLVLGTLPVSAMGTDVADPPASAVDDTPAEVSAAEPEEASVVDETPDGEKARSGEVEAAATYASADVQYKIVHLDCGRKYFSKDWIIALLYEMQNDGYNQLQLAFGNDGLRFLLNDMSFTANGTEYSHQTVVSKVEAGNEAQNNSGDPSYLTETEMNEIIDTAKTLDIEIVPLLNLPGHANAILDIADDAYNASGSDNTLNVSNAEAVNFAMAIFQKYVDYFAAKGCQFFNFGADEYANDVKDGGAFSFSRLGQTGYANFAAFINGLAGYIDGKSVDAAVHGKRTHKLLGQAAVIVPKHRLGHGRIHHKIGPRLAEKSLGPPPISEALALPLPAVPEALADRVVLTVAPAVLLPQRLPMAAIWALAAKKAPATPRRWHWPMALWWFVPDAAAEITSSLTAPITAKPLPPSWT